MPPLFLYAVVFLVALTAVTFVLCHRAESDAGRADAAGPPPVAPAERPAPEAPLRRVADARGAPGSADPAAHVPAEPGAPPARSGERTSAAWTGAAPPTGAGERASGSRIGAANVAARDVLARRVADLDRRVAELQTERQALQEELLRLRAAEAGPPAALRPLRTVRAAEAEPRLRA